MTTHKRRKEKKAAVAPAGRTGNPVSGNRTTLARTILLSGVLLPIVVLAAWTILRFGAGGPTAETIPVSAVKSQTPSDVEPAPVKKPPAKHEKEPENFLDAFGKEAEPARDGNEPPLSNDELERRFFALEKTKEEHKILVDRIQGLSGKKNQKEYRAVFQEREELLSRLDAALAGLEKDMARARKARPADPVVAWLTAELLIFVGAEPELILPHLEKAQEGGFTRSRLLASLARTQTEANQFEKAYQAAAKALAGDDKDRYIWKTFGQAAFHLERFNEVLDRLGRAFPGQAPDWAQALRLKALQHQTHWQAEQKLRLEEAKADDLPRVRIVVEHRRFARDPEGRAKGKIEKTGTGEFILELFEDQAPATVANFLSLVAGESYEGPRFYLAESASVIAGGDPQSRTGDPAADGTGGPGYVIPDEFNLPGARRHFRGTISMVNTGPHTAGSQFFINLVPKLEMDGFFTVFGRVIKGMDVVDAITRGRTNPEVGRYGQIIPGDLLLRAEILSKRPHEYKVIKERAK